MKKILTVLLALLLAFGMAACGSDTAQPDANVQPDVSEDNSLDTADSGETIDTTMEVPVIEGPIVQDSADGDAYELLYIWPWTEGADGYEVREWSKYYMDEEYPETFKTTFLTADDAQMGYVCGGQDRFDFKVIVRAYKDVDGQRVYSSWSEEAIGSLGIPQ